MDAVSSALQVAAGLGMEVTESPAASVDQQHGHLVAADSSGGQGRAQRDQSTGVGAGRRLHFGAHGAPVVAPLDLAGPVVHRFGGWEMTFWPYHAQTGATPEPVALGRTLERLHDLLDEAARRERWSLPGWDQGPKDVNDRLCDEGFAPTLNQMIEPFSAKYLVEVTRSPR